jgi:hypothetical protein
MGAQLGNLGRAHLLGLRDMAEGGDGDGVFLCGALSREPGGGAPSLGTLKDI